MTRREILGAACLADVALARSAAGALPDFWRSRISDVDRAIATVKKGHARLLAKSAGGRNIHLVAWGEPDKLPSTANYNSACGGGDPASYRRKDGRQKPVVLLLGPVHGQEFEGLAGLNNFVHVAETGRDLRGREWPGITANLQKLRVVIVPLANPDGRARCPVDSWMGHDMDQYVLVSMGTSGDGTGYKWPVVKRFHPMRGAALGKLGAYFNDSGVNLMHDEWFAPMAPETRALLKLAIDEAPDFIVSLHSHGSSPSVEPTAYVTEAVKKSIQEFGARLYARYAKAGLPARTAPPPVRPDGALFPPPSFNLASALHHACGAVSLVHECTAGIMSGMRLELDGLLDVEMILFDELLQYAVENPVRWAR
jgi:hypothetical protein